MPGSCFHYSFPFFPLFFVLFFFTSPCNETKAVVNSCHYHRDCSGSLIVVLFLLLHQQMQITPGKCNMEPMPLRLNAILNLPPSIQSLKSPKDTIVGKLKTVWRYQEFCCWLNRYKRLLIDSRAVDNSFVASVAGELMFAVNQALTNSEAPLSKGAYSNSHSDEYCLSHCGSLNRWIRS